MMRLSPPQETVVQANDNILLWGDAGSGKSVALQHRLLRLLQEGESAYNILVLVSEYGLEQPFLQLIRESDVGAYADLHIATYNSLAREITLLFWPLVARDAGFAQPHKPPVFLEYDMAQLLMWRILTPMQDEGAFANLRLRPQRIVSQLIDILNRAAFNGLTLEEAVARQAHIFAAEPDRIQNLHDAAQAAGDFRRFCLENSLLDFSLTIEVFDNHLVEHSEFNRYFKERYRHLLVDNIEEHTAAAQRFVANQMGGECTVAVAYDRGGGYRRFLSADPVGAKRFNSLCRQIDFAGISYASSEPTQHIGNLVESFLLHRPNLPVEQASDGIRAIVKSRYRREMLEALPDALLDMMAGDEIQPSDIALIAPYLDGALQYSLRQTLGNAGIPYRLLRRRSTPRDEPRIRAWLIWLALGHPDWGVPPAPYDVAEALTISIEGVDPARAALLVKDGYDAAAGILTPISELSEAICERIGEETLQTVERLRLWLAENGQTMTLDQFLYALFNDLLALPPFQSDPEKAIDAAAICDWLTRTAANLRRSAPNIGLTEDAEIGRAFVDGIYQGLVTANPPDLGDPPDPDGIAIATTYGYLLSGLTSKIQVWLDAGITGWWQTPFQPLSNAFVMAPSRSDELSWTAQEEIDIRNELLTHIVRGLTNRCSNGVILAVSDLDRAGQRQNGQLWRALQPARTRVTLT